MISRLFEDDVPKITALQAKEGFLDGWSNDQLLSSFKRDNFLAFGEFIEDNLVAFITLTLSVDSADIEDVLVSRDFRRQGLAKGLIYKAERELKDKGINKIFLEVRQSNLSALTLYEKCGFKFVSVRKRYYDDGENAIVLVKEI